MLNLLVPLHVRTELTIWDTAEPEVLASVMRKQTIWCETGLDTNEPSPIHGWV